MESYRNSITWFSGLGFYGELGGNNLDNSYVSYYPCSNVLLSRAVVGKNKMGEE